MKLKQSLLLGLCATALAQSNPKCTFEQQSPRLSALEGDYDFIVVGGGTAGNIVASRLSEKHDVLLLETGERLYDDASLNLEYFTSLMTGVDTTSIGESIKSFASIVGDKIIGKNGDEIGSVSKGFPGFAPHLQETPFLSLFSCLADTNHIYTTVPQLSAQKREVDYPRGNILGGSSATNTMCYFRGTPRDFDHWRDEFGLKEWGYDNVLPFFKKYENNQDVSDPSVHGHSGPINITIAKNHAASPNTDAYTEAAIKLGWPKITDASNPETQYGASDSWQSFVGDNGKRSDSSAYLALLDKQGKICWNREKSECTKSQRLSVWTGKLVTKLLINEDKRTFGVEYVNKKDVRTFDHSYARFNKASKNEGVKHHDAFDKWDRLKTQANIEQLGAPVAKELAFDWSRNDVQYVPDTFQDIAHLTKSVKARYEVILSAGSIESAKLLMLSGIGPKDHLSEKQIKIVADLPVGRRTQDHQEVVVAYEFPKSFVPPFDMASETIKGFPELRKHVSGQRSFFSNNGVPAGLEGSSEGPHSKSKIPKWHLHHINILFENYDFNLVSYPESKVSHSRLPRSLWELYTWTGLRYHSHNCELSQNHAYGRIELKNRDPLQSPFVDPRWGSSDEDNAEIVNCIETVREIMKNSDPQWVGEELEPSRSAVTKEQLTQFVRDSVWGHHISGSAPAGNCTSEQAVVDGRGRVYGINGLRVADASIFPSIMHGNIAGPTMMVGEKIAHIILQDYSSYKDEL